MGRLSLIIATVAAALAGMPTSHASDYIYFPDLAERVLSGDGEAFQQVLVKAGTVLPGERLEELAEISSKFVLTNPAEFLRAQSTNQHCFGVDFMGSHFADNEPARVQERDLRYRALASVQDASLTLVKARCLAVLDAS